MNRVISGLISLNSIYLNCLKLQKKLESAAEEMPNESAMDFSDDTLAAFPLQMPAESAFSSAFDLLTITVYGGPKGMELSTHGF